MKQSLPDIFLAILMESDPPTIVLCIVHIVRMIFSFYSVSFWPSPWNCHLSCLVMGKKNCILSTLAKVMGSSKSNVSKNVSKVPYFETDLGVGSRFGPLCRLKRSKSKFFVFPQFFLEITTLLAQEIPEPRRKFSVFPNHPFSPLPSHLCFLKVHLHRKFLHSVSRDGLGTSEMWITKT